MYPVSPAFLDALRGSHTMTLRATAYDGADTTPKAGGEGLLISDGSIRADGRSLVRRTLDATFVSGSVDLRDVLTTDGTEVLVERGILYPTGRVEYAPVGRFRVDEAVASVKEPGALKVKGADLFARLVDDRFLAPRSGSAGVTIGTQIRNLVQDTIPGALVFGFDTVGATATMRAGIVWETERGDALADLATSLGCVLYADPTGAFVLERVKDLTAPPDWLVDSGVRGTLIDGTRTSKRAGVYNVVVASSVPTDGSTPVYASASDDDPTSPTYVSGPFGRVPRFYSSPLLTTVAQCASAATALLAKSIGARASLDLEALPNPALEVGDRIDVFLPDGGLQRHLVDGFTLPLGPSGSMSITTRTVEGDDS